jgi:SAM-dependent methyltransferase
MNASADQGKLWDLWADEFDDWTAAKDPGPAAEFLSGLVPGGYFLELGAGTGRVALELARRGCSVHGVEISKKMAAKLVEKSVGLPVEVTVGDMAEIPVPGRFDAVYAVSSTIFHLIEQEQQVSCFRRTADVLKPGGAFVLECFLPSPAMLSPAKNVVLRRLDHENVSLSATTTDIATQRITFQEVTLSNGGLRLLPVEERYSWPAELDLMGQIADLCLEIRYANFTREPFNRISPGHVSIYRKGVS